MFPFISKHHKKPDSKKNSFQNYFDHMKSSIDKEIKQIRQLEQKIQKHDLNEYEKCAARVNHRAQNLFASLNALEPICDRYDYMDDVFTAVAIHLCKPVIILAGCAYSLFEAGYWAGIKTNLLEDDGQDHAAKALCGIAYTLALTAECFIRLANAVVSLISRPIFTAVKGYREQPDENRFYTDSLESLMNPSPQASF